MTNKEAIKLIEYYLYDKINQIDGNTLAAFNKAIEALNIERDCICNSGEASEGKACSGKIQIGDYASYSGKGYHSCRYRKMLEDERQTERSE